MSLLHAEMDDWTKTFGERLPGGFRGWRFEPGMLFASDVMWWGSRKPRRLPHEGVDFATYDDLGGGRRKVLAGADVSCALDGVVAAVFDDFIGQTVVIYHDHAVWRTHSPYHSSGETTAPAGEAPLEHWGLHLVYGHVTAHGSLVVGAPIQRGEMVGAVAESAGSAPAHLHLTAAWACPTFLPSEWSWKTMGRSHDRVMLTSPLRVLASECDSVVAAATMTAAAAAPATPVNAGAVDPSSYRTIPCQGPHLKG